MFQLRRRDFLSATSAGMGTLLLPNWLYASEETPHANPAGQLKLEWTNQFKWNQVVDITQMNGDNWEAKLAVAQEMVTKQGGGVIYFPPGKYRFSNHIRLRDGVVLRGADPVRVTSAKEENYAPASELEFPRYEPTLKGEGTPIDTAFKGIYLENPAQGSWVGVVNLTIQRGHIHLSEGENHACGSHRMVYGCLMKNAAVADPAVPYVADDQPVWQRFTSRHHAAIDVKGENLLIANNRLPRSGEENFVMPNYKLRMKKGKTPVYDITFDYDNRPGLYINHSCVGGAGGSGDDGTPETHPYGFRKGIVIVDNYVYNSGRMCIGFCGDCVLCARNVTRIEKDVWRPTVTGRDMTTGSSTNDNRAIEMRGWRWAVEENDCVVHRNWAAEKSYLINDGEGLMHEDHCNSTVLESRLVGNKINSYLSIYKCGPIDGLLIEGNDVSVPGKIADIFVVANRNSGSQPCRKVSVLDNVTHSNGILVAGDPAANNVISGNVHKGNSPGFLRNEAKAKVSDNKNYV